MQLYHPLPYPVRPSPLARPLPHAPPLESPLSRHPPFMYPAGHRSRAPLYPVTLLLPRRAKAFEFSFQLSYSGMCFQSQLELEELSWWVFPSVPLSYSTHPSFSLPLAPFSPPQFVPPFTPSSLHIIYPVGRLFTEDRWREDGVGGRRDRWREGGARRGRWREDGIRRRLTG